MTLPTSHVANTSFMPLPLFVAKALLEKAKGFAAYAYAPYSQFPVGAALLLAGQQVLGGCNVENMSFGLTLCAERTALVKAISQGHKRAEAIAIWAAKPEFNAVLPCGACRQVLWEFLPPQAPVVFFHPETGEVTQLALETLLPYAFKLEKA
jgi:cytidine deaminase